MNMPHILRTNVKVVTTSLLLLCSFYSQSQSKEDDSKKEQQSDEKESSYINVVGPLPYGTEPKINKEEIIKEEPQVSLLDSRIARISELEAEHGPYHQELILELVKLGAVYSEQQNHELARNAYLRSLEIHRSNYGLHSFDKSPIVEQLIKVNRDLGDWEEVNRYYEYLYWLYRRTYGEDSTKLIPMLSALIAWKTEAIEGELFGDRKTLANEAIRASRRGRDIAKLHSESLQPRKQDPEQATLTPQ